MRKNVMFRLNDFPGIAPIMINTDGSFKMGDFVILKYWWAGDEEDEYFSEVVKGMKRERWKELHGSSHGFNEWQMNYILMVIKEVPFVFKVRFEPTVFIMPASEGVVVELELRPDLVSLIERKARIFEDGRVDGQTGSKYGKAIEDIGKDFQDCYDKEVMYSWMVDCFCKGMVVT